MNRKAQRKHKLDNDDSTRAIVGSIILSDDSEEEFDSSGDESDSCLTDDEDL